MEYDDYFAVLQTQEPALAEELTSVRTLEHVLLWMHRRGLALESVEIIQQDEYALDFILPLEDGRYLVWGIT